ncbi:MAG: serine/threonine-protein phosphatase [Ignavibacteria bacterium]|nr:serine/threonine-protein phosphatase [Ignavibacteria bacterium]
MDPRKLYRTLENIIREAPSFDTDEDFLVHVIAQIINNEEINIIGGRLWRLNESRNAYTLIAQMGNVDLIQTDYRLGVEKYPMFKKVGLFRSVLATETDEYLIEKGIYHYSATGVGVRHKFKEPSGEPYYLYSYLIALNAKGLDDEFLNTLNIISMTLSSILRTKHIESSAKESRQELEKAKEIQRSILPEHEYEFGNYVLFGLSMPDRIVGGDFFDYLESEDKDRLGVALGDAASKGLSAASQALYVSGALKMGVGYQSKMSGMVSRINNLVNETFPYERFVTLFYCELSDDKRGLCQYVNAGQNPPVFLEYETGRVEMLSSTGPVLGPAPYQKYGVESINFKVNDLLLLYSDGIIEATNQDFEFFGEDKLIENLKKLKDKDPKDVCNIILQEVNVFSAKGVYSDDRTLVAIKRFK